MHDYLNMFLYYYLVLRLSHASRTQLTNYKTLIPDLYPLNNKTKIPKSTDFIIIHLNHAIPYEKNTD